MANQIKVAIADSILTLRAQGWSYRKIAQALGLHRETVARYVHLGQAASKPASNLSTGSGVAEGAKPATILSTGSDLSDSPKPASNPVAVSRNLSTGKPGPESLCETHRKTIEEKLALGLTAQRIWQDLGVEHGFAGRYASVKRYVRRLGKSRELPFRRMECPPGEEAQIDFGPVALVAQSNGRFKRYPVLRVVLSHSRKGYSEALRRQGAEEFLRALENAFRAFGGAPKTLVPDYVAGHIIRLMCPIPLCGGSA